MTIFNLGSINVDHVYQVPRIPALGETLASTDYAQGLGGKGANLSVAAAKAGGRVVHVGAVGEGAERVLAELEGYGVGLEHVARREGPTGHAVITVDAGGENAIVLLPGANMTIAGEEVAAALGAAQAGDIFVTQNETNGQEDAAARASAAGLRVCYCAAPFEAGAVSAMLPHADLLILNAVEAAQLQEATGRAPDALGVADVIVTRGAEGVTWYGPEGAAEFSAPKVTARDTTGAGDTFAGYLLAGLDEGQGMEAAIGLALRAAALKVTRPGAAAGIPLRGEVEASPSENK
ncbi:ribokinase [Pseudoroseicyclus tamaricis]|uniref:Ribokinase n=1 Tax=Pseudoroseicyclus tamaricis TaxID=2705421 RepID=A0A6B2JYA9_9RHOB|nr:ribokinase [Pseudoroseicyclus tamaricis]NDV02765.1 ribokinase [Pseudoroseicyclus tamaricis]